MIFRKRNTHITTITQPKGESILSVAKALQRRIIRVSEMFEKHLSSGDARLERSETRHAPNKIKKTQQKVEQTFELSITTTLWLLNSMNG